jgi:putative flippase GtrA
VITSIINHTVFRFLVVGAVNTFFSYAVYAGFLFAGLSYVVANFLALIAGIIFSFRTQGAFVFHNRDWRLFTRFAICWGFIYLANISVIKMIMMLGFDAYVAGAIAIPLMAAASYLIQKLIVFRTPNSQA